MPKCLYPLQPYHAEVLYMVFLRVNHAIAYLASSSKDLITINELLGNI